MHNCWNALYNNFKKISMMETMQIMLELPLNDILNSIVLENSCLLFTIVNMHIGKGDYCIYVSLRQEGFGKCILLVIWYPTGMCPGV